MFENKALSRQLQARGLGLAKEADWRLLQEQLRQAGQGASGLADLAERLPAFVGVVAAVIRNTSAIRAAIPLAGAVVAAGADGGQ